MTPREKLLKELLLAATVSAQGTEVIISFGTYDMEERNNLFDLLMEIVEVEDGQK